MSSISHLVITFLISSRVNIDLHSKKGTHLNHHHPPGKGLQSLLDLLGWLGLLGLIDLRCLLGMLGMLDLFGYEVTNEVYDGTSQAICLSVFLRKEVSIPGR